MRHWQHSVVMDFTA